MADADVIHSFLSFSRRGRWRACPGSVRLSKGLTDKSSANAKEGSDAHKIKEMVMGRKLRVGSDPDAPFPKIDRPVAELEEMMRHANDYVVFVRTFIDGYPDAIVLEEQKVDASALHPALFGTADTIIWIPSIRKLIVIDYKYGFRAVDVGTVEDTNPQLAAYGVSAALMLMSAQGVAPAEIVLAVAQPRLPLGERYPQLHIPDAPSWLQVESEKMRTEALATEDPNAPLVPGDHCRYCKAAMHGKCPAVKQYVGTALNVAAGTVALLDIPTDELLALYSARSAFKPFLEEIEARVEQLAKVGHARLQVTVVKGRQMWADPKSAAMTLLAIGRADLVQPVALSDALPALPTELHGALVKRTAPSSRIKVVDAPHVKDVAKMFDKYTKNV